MLIAFEGLDQSGKATQARRLRTHLEGRRPIVHALSFPEYETPIGRELRSALAGDRQYGPEVMQLLYVANRFEFKTRLDAWLAADAVVICDRYQASSIAYGEAQGLSVEWLSDIQRGLPEAQLTVLLDIDPHTAVRRKSAGRDKYERDLGLLARVRESYRRQAAAHGWVVVNGEEEPDRVAAQVAQAATFALGLPSTRARS
jgi:dTMP kinase